MRNGISSGQVSNNGAVALTRAVAPFFFDPTIIRGNQAFGRLSETLRWSGFRSDRIEIIL